MSASATVIEIGRAARNKRDKRERLIRAARELFQTKGFQATTTSEIAELADVAKGTLFFHAKSKEALLVMMFQEQVGDAIRRAFHRSANARVRRDVAAEPARLGPRAHFRQGVGLRARRTPRRRSGHGWAVRRAARPHRRRQKPRRDRSRNRS